MKYIDIDPDDFVLTTQKNLVEMGTPRKAISDLMRANCVRDVHADGVQA